MAAPLQPTQMIILALEANAAVEEQASEAGQVWAAALRILEQSPGFRRLYWGRHVEEPEKIQIHIGMWIEISPSEQNAEEFG
jgi:heme-degrading monooxygenase HmoA